MLPISEVDFALEEEMPLNNDDRRWVSNEFKRLLSTFEGSIDSRVTDSVATAFEILKPKGWKKAGENIVAFGSPVAICALIATLLGVTAGALYQSFSHVKEETAFRTNMGDRMGGLEVHMTALRALIASSQPGLPQNQKAAKELIVEASQRSIPPIPAPVVEQAGKSFIEASRKESSAWDVALNFVSYRSHLNTAPRDALWNNPISSSSQPQTMYHLEGVAGKPAPRMFFYRLPFVAQDQAARAELISKPLEQPAAKGIAVFSIQDATISLDGMRFRHVVMDNVEVHYSNQGVILEDVSFVNCRFVMDNNSNSQMIAEKILTSDRVNLTLKPA